jgi:hypothetical protein
VIETCLDSLKKINLPIESLFELLRLFYTNGKSEENKKRKKSYFLSLQTGTLGNIYSELAKILKLVIDNFTREFN